MEVLRDWWASCRMCFTEALCDWWASCRMRLFVRFLWTLKEGVSLCFGVCAVVRRIFSWRGCIEKTVHPNHLLLLRGCMD